MSSPEKSDSLALHRHAAVCWIQEALKENFTLTRALALASQRRWGARCYSADTLEKWYYAFRAEGFSALQRQPRKDKGTRKALSPEACQALVDLRRANPELKVPVLVGRLVQQGILEAGSFSLPSVYRLLAAKGLDSHSVKHNRLTPGGPGPTKAFECGYANELWMADMMFGPTLRLASGKVLQTRLCGLLDDCSRLIPHAQYYDSEKLCWFLDCLRQGLARRGFPEKLYTDRGKIFTSQHLQIICANLKVRLIHAKPYAAWSRGKQERWFRTLQETLKLAWCWIRWTPWPNSTNGSGVGSKTNITIPLTADCRERPRPNALLGGPSTSSWPILRPTGKGSFCPAAIGAFGWTPRSACRASSGKCPCTCAAAWSNCALIPSVGAGWKSGWMTNSPD